MSHDTLLAICCESAAQKIWNIEILDTKYRLEGGVGEANDFSIEGCFDKSGCTDVVHNE